MTNKNGFTLIEVILAIAVGMIILGGFVCAYNAIKENQAMKAASDRVYDATIKSAGSAQRDYGFFDKSDLTLPVKLVHTHICNERQFVMRVESVCLEAEQNGYTLHSIVQRGTGCESILIFKQKENSSNILPSKERI